MITDAVLAFVSTLTGWVVDLLPAGSALPIPSLSAVGEALGAVDSLVPIGGVLNVALGLLLGGVAFIALRLVLVVWNLVWP